MKSMSDTDPKKWEVDQVIALDWYDGARAGLCRLRVPKAEFQFELLAERPTEDGLDDRLFAVSTIPAGTLEAVLSSLSFAGPPATPVWAPRWESRNQSDLEGANQAIARAKRSAVATALVIRTSDFVTFLGCWETRPSETISNWFAHLGLGSNQSEAGR